MIYFFTGDNHFAVKQRLQKLTKEFTAEYGDLALERIDAEEVSPATVIDATQSLPFLSPAKFVLVQNASDKDLLEKLTEVDVSESITVVVVIPKVDKRATYYKKISKLPNFELFEMSNAHDLPRWVVDYAKNQEATISSADARYLVERVGTDQMLLGNDIDKLVTYNTYITKDSINELTDPLPQSTIFQLLDAAFAGNSKEVEKLYKEQRAQKVEPQAIIGMIAWQLHILATVKAAGNRSVDEISREAKINPFVVRKTQNLAHKLTMQDVKKLVKGAHDLDLLLKTKSVDADQAILLYLMGIKDLRVV